MTERLAAPGHRVLQPVVYARRRSAAPEQEDWTGRWICVGLAEQLQRAGDVLPATVSRHAVHVRRDVQGRLTAARNAKSFGGCMSVPVQCAGARKIRCPHLACGFSEDPGVLDDASDPDGRARRQFIGADPGRLVPVPLAQWGPLLLVRVGAEPVPSSSGTVEPLQDGRGPVALAGLRAEHIAECHLALGWRSGGPAILTALAAQQGMNPCAPRASEHGVTLVASLRSGDGGDGSGHWTGHVIWPHLVLASIPGHVLFALLRPTGPGTCSVLSAVLGPPPAEGSDRGASVAAAWRAAMVSAAGG